MISLKRNNKGELVPATGLRNRESSIYSPNQTEQFKISRSKFNDFLTCKRCFYLDRVKGLISPSMPGWTLNETTDILLKKEFDVCREMQTPHPIFERYNLNHVVPFKHEDIDKWRDSLHHGLKVRFKDSNIVLHGGVDDIWIDTNTKELIVVDYKSQANKNLVNTEDYLSNTYHQGYKVQMDFYSYLLTEMNFDVSPVSYFYVCNADRNALSFSSKLNFQETLVPYEWDSSWVEDKVIKMIGVLNSTELPERNSSCENCAYARQRTINEKYISLPMNSAKELIDWFWKDAKFGSHSSSLPREDKGVCQCGTEKLFKRSSDPSRMRAFMMVGALIDQMIWTHFRDLHPVFSENFRYPKVHSHPTLGMATPNWMAYTRYGYDKKMDWNVVSEVCDLLLNDLCDWFRDNGLLEEMKKFQQILKTEVIIEFETVNRDKLMPIVERIEQGRS